MGKFRRLEQAHIQLLMDKEHFSNAGRLYLWAISISKQPSMLKPAAISDFDKWYLSNGLAGTDADSFKVAHFTVRQAQEAIEASSPTTAQRAIEKALERGYLIRLSTGKKGNASLYAVCPLPDICTHFTNESETNMNSNLYTSEHVFVHNEAPICTHSPNESEHTYTLPIHNLESAQAGGAEKTAPLVRIGDTCPYCITRTSKPGTIQPIKAAFDLENPKDPSLLACANCKAVFFKDGTTRNRGKY